MQKAEIRKQALKNRLSLSTQEYDNLNRQLLAQFKLLNFSKIKTLHIFLPINEKNEPNTFLFIYWLQKNHSKIKIIIPKADFKTSLMSHHEYLGKDDLQKNYYNILEPKKGKIHSDGVDMVIIPLIAFDKKGYRVGFGKGFYDRFLQNSNAQKIGLSLFNAIDKIDDVHENDIRLDLCITPSEIIKF